ANKLSKLTDKQIDVIINYYTTKILVRDQKFRTYMTESTLKSRFNPSNNKNHMTKLSSLKDVSNIKASISAKSSHASSSEDIISEDNKSSLNTNNNNYILQDNILLETNPKDLTEVSILLEKVSSETEDS
ncbi:5116_t:CDS:2, partial [Scutellospora calospora]